MTWAAACWPGDWAGTAPALGLAAGLLAVVTAGAVLAARKPGPWRAG